jgi:hypothetical protein
MNRVKFVAAVTLGLAVGGHPAAAAQAPGQDAQPFQDPAGFALQSNTMKGANGRPLLYGGTAPGANWFIADMGEPGDLPPLAETPAADGTTWSSFNAAAGVRLNVVNGAATATLRQNGAGLACSGPRGGVKEYDLAVWPNGENPGYPTAINAAYGSNRDFPALSQLAALSMSGTFTVDSITQPLAVSPCVINHAGAGLTVILVDDHAVPRQMFWYLLSFAKFCLPAAPDAPGPDYRNCQAAATHPRPAWFWTGASLPHRQIAGHGAGGISLLNFAVGEGMEPYGLAGGHAPGQPVPITVDLLPRLAQLIRSGKYGIDPDLSHWRLADAGFGQVIWGDTALSTTWRGFVPAWTLKTATPP